MTAYRCDHGRQIKSLLKHIIRKERSIYQIRVQSKPTESPTKKKMIIFFQSWRPILHSFERKTFNVPSLITKVSNNCQTHAILSFIKRKPSITTHDAVQESYTFAFVYECFPFILGIYVLIYSNFRPSYWNTASLPIIKAATPKRTFQGTLDFTYSNSVYCKMIITGQRVRRFPSPYGKKRGMS